MAPGNGQDPEFSNLSVIQVFHAINQFCSALILILGRWMYRTVSRPMPWESGSKIVMNDNVNKGTPHWL